MSDSNDILAARPKRVNVTALESITRAEIDIQISTAKAYPRSVSDSVKRVKELACLTQETAASCFYAIPRDGKVIAGPSVRLAEILANAWGNLRIATRIVAEENDHVVAQAVCHDLETNVAVASEFRAKITGRDGRRFSADMVNVTANAACAKALRNAIFDVIPSALLQETYDTVRATAAGDSKTFGAGRVALVAKLAKHGIDAARVFSAVHRKGIEDITRDDLVVLAGMETALREGHAKADELFPLSQDQKPKTRAAEIKEQMAATAPEPEPVDTPASNHSHWTKISDCEEAHAGDTFTVSGQLNRITPYAQHTRIDIKADGKLMTCKFIPPLSQKDVDVLSAAYGPQALMVSGRVTFEKNDRVFVGESYEPFGISG